MRIPTVVIPVLLVGGYAGFHAVGAHRADEARTSAEFQAVARQLAVDDTPRAPLRVDTWSSVPAVRTAVAVSPRPVDDAIYVHAAVNASLAASIDGLVNLVSQELDTSGDELAEARRLIELSASIVGTLAAELDGYVEIETAGGERMHVSTPHAKRSP